MWFAFLIIQRETYILMVPCWLRIYNNLQESQSSSGLFSPVKICHRICEGDREGISSDTPVTHIADVLWFTEHLIPLVTRYVFRDSVSIVSVRSRTSRRWSVARLCPHWRAQEAHAAACPRGAPRVTFGRHDVGVAPRQCNGLWNKTGHIIQVRDDERNHGIYGKI